MKFVKKFTGSKVGITKEVLYQIIRSIFIFSFVLYLFFVVAETAIKGFITNTLNYDFLLIILIITGIVNTFIPLKDNQSKKTNNTGLSGYFQIFFLTVAGSLIIYYITKDLGDLSWILTILSGLIIIALGFILMRPNEELKDYE